MNPQPIIIGLCLTGFLLRIVFVLFFNNTLLYPDEERYWSEAMSLLDRGVFVSGDGQYAQDMPLTAIIIAATVKLFGCGVVGVKLLFAAISSLTIYIVGRVAYVLFKSTQAVVLAVAIAAFYPFFIYYSSLILSETLFLFFVSLIFLSLFTCNAKNCWQVGVLLGLGHLVRPTFIYFLPFMWGWLYFFRKIRSVPLVLSMLCFVIVVLPWGIRNYSVLGEFHVTTSISGRVLWEGNNPWNLTGGVSGSFTDPHKHLENLPEGLNELERDNWKKDQAVAFIKENPVHFVRLSLKKFSRFWHLWPNHESFDSWKYKLASLGSFGVVLVLFLMSPFIVTTNREKLFFLYLFVLYYTAIHMVTIGSIRYRLPIEPLLIAIAGATLATILTKMTKD